MDRGAPVLVRVGAHARLEALFDREDICRGPTCGARILWCRTPRGKWIPVDPADDDDAATEHEPHWSTCLDRALFRRQAGNGR